MIENERSTHPGGADCLLKPAAAAWLWRRFVGCHGNRGSKISNISLVCTKMLVHGFNIP